MCIRDSPWANFHTFRREAGTVALKNLPEEESDDEEQANELEETQTGMDYIPYTPQNEEEFFQQLEQWNDEDEYTRCIQALNAIPEDWRNYRTSYALGRALENYAILGDHQEGTPYYKGEKALRRAIEAVSYTHLDVYKRQLCSGTDMKIEMPSIVFFCPLQKQETVRPRLPLPLITMPTCQKMRKNALDLPRKTGN